MIEKTDDALDGLNDFLKSLTEKITPNIVLLIVIVNGFLIGLATTGFMGDKSLSVWSLSFFLIIWQLLIICVFSSHYVILTTNYLNKFFLCGWIGYMWQWQFFGMLSNHFYPEIKTIGPPFENVASGLMMGYFSLIILFGYCFRNNNLSQKQNKRIYSLEDNDART